jgi:hypothetical protein
MTKSADLQRTQAGFTLVMGKLATHTTGYSSIPNQALNFDVD